MTTSPRARILVVDDGVEMAEMIADALEGHGYQAVPLASSRAAWERLQAEHFDALVTDLRMPHLDGMALLQQARTLAPERPVLVMTAFGAIDSAIEAIRLGAYHYFTKPFKMAELVLFVERALAERSLRQEATTLKQTLRERYSPEHLVAESPGMRELLDVLEQVAPRDVPVLFSGETGTGKGLLARTLHAQSRRASKAFVHVNCAAIPETLLESELFGHTKGAFTGATADRAGLFAEADGGTLFLDEIGEMPIGLQAKLLHVLESQEVRPVGASRPVRVDVRMVTATHRDLRALVQRGEFREDLLYRLEVVPLEIPALRHRREDLPRLILQLLGEAKRRHPDSPVERFSPEAFSRLLEYRWPGNVRELGHVLERMVLLGKTMEVPLARLPPAVLSPSPPTALVFSGDVLPMRELQRQYAHWALEQLEGQRVRTAEALNVDKKTLAKWLSEPPES